MAEKGPGETFEKREEEGEECSQVIAIEYLENWENTQIKA